MASVTIELPTELFERVQQVAQFSHVSEEVALVESIPWLYTTAPSETILKKLSSLPDVQLWAVVFQRLIPQDAARLKLLMDESKQKPLPSAEQQELDFLIHLLDYQILLRSEALLLLKERGYDLESYRRGVHLP